jgi:hypothetical protein
VSLLISYNLIPIETNPVLLNNITALEDSGLMKRIIEYSPSILADAVNSVALLWLVSYERWASHDRVIEKALSKERRIQGV